MTKTGLKFLWGSGSTANLVIDHLTSDFDAVISPGLAAAKFRGIPIIDASEIANQQVSSLTIASMYYPQILLALTDISSLKFPIRIFTGHQLHPGYLLAEPSFELAWNEMEQCKERLTSPNENSLDRLSHGEHVRLFPTRDEHLAFAIGSAPRNGLALEFGVHQGTSLHLLRSCAERKVYGFDSLQGFDATSILGGWKFHAPCPADLSAQVERLRKDPEMRVGFFRQTLEPFLDEFRNPIDFVHYDAGDRLTCEYVLRTIWPQLHQDAVIVFDEFLPFGPWSDSAEYAALCAVCEDNHSDFELLSRHVDGCSAGVRLRTKTALL